MIKAIRWWIGYKIVNLGYYVVRFGDWIGGSMPYEFDFCDDCCDDCCDC